MRIADIQTYKNCLLLQLGMITDIKGMVFLKPYLPVKILILPFSKYYKNHKNTKKRNHFVF